MDLKKIAEANYSAEAILSTARLVETLKTPANKKFILEWDGEVAEAQKKLMTFVRISKGEEKTFEEMVAEADEKYAELKEACDGGNAKPYDKAKEFFATVRNFAKEKETPTSMLEDAEKIMVEAKKKAKKFCGRRDASIKTKTEDIRHAVNPSTWEKLNDCAETKKLLEKHNVMASK